MQGCSCWMRAGNAKLNFEHGGKKKILINIAELDFLREKRKGARLGKVLPLMQWLVMCFVISDGQLVKAEFQWGSLLLLSCMNTMAGNSPL